jgi:hypothetical protein
MTPPEQLAVVAGRILADIATGQPVQDPRQGDPMPDDPVEAEARRDHAAVCREYNPDATDEQIAKNWNGLGAAGRDGWLKTARRRLAEEATR